MNDDKFLNDIENDIDFKLDNIDQTLREIDIKRNKELKETYAERYRNEKDYRDKKFKYLFNWEHLEDKDKDLIEEIVKCIFFKNFVMNDCSCGIRIKTFYEPCSIAPIYDNPFERSTIEVTVVRIYCPNCGRAFSIRAERVILSIVENRVSEDMRDYRGY